jgi:MFS family permease
VEILSYPVVIGIVSVGLGLVFLLTSYDIYVWEFFFTYTLLFGIVGGFIMQIAFGILVDVFEDDERAFAVGISSTGSGLGYMLFGCLAANFVVIHDYISWRELFRYYSLSGVFLFLFALLTACFVDKDAEKTHNKLTETTTETEKLEENNPLIPSSLKKKERLYGWALLLSGDSRCVRLFISHFLSFIMEVVPIKFSIIYASSANNFDENMYYYVPIAMGVGTVLFRLLIVGFSSQTSSFHFHRFLQIGLLCLCLSLAYTPATSEVIVLILLGLYAGLSSSLFPVIVLRTTDYLGLYQHARNFGIQLYAVGMGILLGGMIGGAIYDATSSTKDVFFMCAILFFIAFLYDEIFFPETSWIQFIMSWLCYQNTRGYNHIPDSDNNDNNDNHYDNHQEQRDDNHQDENQSHHSLQIQS